jgi:DNA polymerase III delta prime subunit
MAPPGEVDHRPLTERIRPARLSEVLGNRRAVFDLRKWARSWENETGSPPLRRAALLEGPPGVGKTTAAVALAQENGWSLVEMNASEARNQEAIGEVAGRASLTNTLGIDGTYRGTRSGGRTLILLDEADCLTGRAREEAASRAPATNLREFLRGRYGSVDSLAIAWGLGRAGNPPPFESWANVPATGGRGAWTKLKEAQRDVADWRSTARTRDASDRGGLGAIARLVRETRQPLVLTVNDPTPLLRYSPVFRTNVVRVRFEAVPPNELAPWLARVSSGEGFRVPSALLDRIVQRSQGDVRAAVTDLEAISVLPEAATAETLFGSRDLEADFSDFVNEVLTHPRFYRSGEIQDRLNSTPDDLLPWMEENVPRAAAEATGRHDSIRVLAHAEQFLAWARRERVYSLWSYASETMTGGASVALAARGHVRTPYVSFPEFLSAMGRSRAQRAARLALLGKLGPRVHLSRRKGVDAFLPFLEKLFAPRGRSRPDAHLIAVRRSVARDLKLSAEDLAYLLGTEPDGPQVREILGSVEEAVAPEPDLAGVTPEPEALAPPPPAGPAARRKVQRRLAEF